jgi:hypothetical protein
MNKETSMNALLIISRISSKNVLLQLAVSLETDEKKKQEMMEKTFNDDRKWLEETFEIKRIKKGE